MDNANLFRFPKVCQDCGKNFMALEKRFSICPRCYAVHTQLYIPDVEIERYYIFDGKCAYCGKDAEQLDHVTPSNYFRKAFYRITGKSHWIVSISDYLRWDRRRMENDPRNQVPACIKCNSSKGARDMETWYRSRPYFSEERLEKILNNTIRTKDFGLE